MAVLTRITNFIPNTLIVSQEVDDEFNQLVNILSGVSTNKDALIKYSHATDPVLRVDQLDAGVIQQWLQNGSLKARVNNDGSIFTPALRDTNGNELLILTPAASAVNEITLTNAATGVAPAITATGGDTNINLNLRPKGTGRVSIPGHTFTLEVNTTQVGNVTGGLDTLHTYTLPVGSLAANGDYLKVRYAGTFASTENDKRVNVTFGGQNVQADSTVDMDSGSWVIDVEYTRLSSTTVLASFNQSLGSILIASGGAVDGGRTAFFKPVTAVLTVADLGANTTAMVVLGESAASATDDVVQRLSRIEVVQR
jgi:hypothetical protein